MSSLGPKGYLTHFDFLVANREDVTFDDERQLCAKSLHDCQACRREPIFATVKGDFDQMFVSFGSHMCVGTRQNGYREVSLEKE